MEKLLPTATIFLLRIRSIALVRVVDASFTIVALIKAYAFSVGFEIPFTGKVDWAMVLVVKNKPTKAGKRSKINVHFFISQFLSYD